MQPQIEISPDLIKEMLCEKEGHKQRQIQFICKLIDCPTRFLCAQCILEHQKHLPYISLIDDFVKQIESKSKQQPNESEKALLEKIKQFIETNEFQPQLMQKLENLEKLLNQQLEEIKQKFDNSKKNIEGHLSKNKEQFIVKFKESVKELSEAVNEQSGQQQQQQQQQQSSSGTNEIEQAEIVQPDQLEEYLIQKASSQEKEPIQYTNTLLEQFYALKYLSMSNFEFGQIINHTKAMNILEQWKTIFSLNFEKKSWESFSALQKLPGEKIEINWKELSCKKTITSEHKKPINQVVYLDENNLIAVAAEDFTITLYDAETYELQKTLEGHAQKIACLIGIENCYLASGSQDRKIIIWNVFTGNKEVILSGSENIVQCLVALPDQQLLSSGSDKLIRLWDIKPPGKLIKSVPEGVNYVQGRCFCMTLGCGELYTGTEHSINILKYPELEYISCLKGHTGVVKSLSLMQQYLVSGADDKSIKIWDTFNKTCIQTLNQQVGLIQKVFSVSNQIIICVGDNGKIVILTKGEQDNWGNCQKQTIENAHEGAIYDFALSNSKMFSVGKDSKINVW